MSTANVTSNDRSNVISLRNDVSTVAISFATSLESHSATGPAFIALREGVVAGVNDLADRAVDLSETGYRRAARDMLARSIRPLWLAATDATARAEVAHADRLRSALVVVDPVNGAEVRAWARSQSPSAVVEAANGDDATLRAIAAAPAALSGLPEAVHAPLRSEAELRALTDVLAKQRPTARTAPSLADPVGGAIDVEALRTEAEGHLTAWRSEGELLATIRPTLGHLINGLALSADLPAATALALLTGTEAA